MTLLTDIKGLSVKDRLILFFASISYIGYVPFASGTVTTFFIGIPLYLGFSKLPPHLYFCAFYIFFWFSCYVSHAAEIILDEKDSSKIVIDEPIGYLVALAFLPFSWEVMTAGFILFRFFDILKIYPANFVESKVPGGLGVCLDDVVAGIYANIILQFAVYFF